MADIGVKVDITADLSKLDQSLAVAQHKAATAGANMQRSLSISPGAGGGGLSFPTVSGSGGGVINPGSTSPINSGAAQFGGAAMMGGGGSNQFHAQGGFGGAAWNGGQAAFGNLRAQGGGMGAFGPPLPPAVPPPFTPGQLGMMALRGTPGAYGALATRMAGPLALAGLGLEMAKGENDAIMAIHGYTGGGTENQRATSNAALVGGIRKGVESLPFVGSALTSVWDSGWSGVRSIGRKTGIHALESFGMTSATNAAAESEIQQSGFRSAITRGMGGYGSSVAEIQAKSQGFQDEENAMRTQRDPATRNRIGAAHSAEIQADRAKVDFNYSWDMKNIASGTRGMVANLYGNSMAAGQENINIQYDSEIARARMGGTPQDRMRAAALAGQKGVASLQNTIANSGYGAETDLRATALGPGTVHEGQANMSDPVIVQLLTDIKTSIQKAGQ